MAAEQGPHGPSPWLPLGNARLIDWKHLGRPASQPIATAWVSRIEGESVLLRSWSDDQEQSTSYYEFFFLAYEDLHGTMVVSTSRPEKLKLRLQISVEVDGRIGYTDVSEFQVHPHTQLYGSTLRTVEMSLGEVPAERIRNVSGPEAEIFEYAPESALLTTCGSWIFEVLDCVRDHLLNGPDDAEVAPAASAAPPIEIAREPTPAPRRAKPAASSAKRSARPAPPPVVLDPPTPEPREPSPLPALSQPPVLESDEDRVLLATTNTGDEWEVNGPETFIGRSKQCQIVLKSQRVSRKHATVTFEEGTYFINDLGAANGIWANHDKIDRERITDGAEYIIGDVLISFRYSARH